MSLKLKILSSKSFKSNIDSDIEEFIFNSNYYLNPLFSTPLWANRLKELIDFDFEYLIVENNNELIALHLFFYGYRGFARFMKYPFLIRESAVKFSKKLYSYITWNNFILFKKEIDDELIQESKKLIYNYVVQKRKNIINAPIFYDDSEFFNNIKIKDWATYILNFQGKTYDEVYKKFRKQARKSIEKTVQKGVEVKTLDFQNSVELEKYINFLKDAQKVTGKRYRINKKDMIKEFKRFQLKNYIYEIFVAYYKNEIHGSLGIWGFKDFVTEHGVNYSEFARKNKLYVQDVLKDGIVKYCIENNINYYDLAGVNLSNNASLKEKNIKQFKEKFRGELFLYKIIDMC